VKQILIVIDKSWLQARSKEHMLSIFSNNRLLLPDMLFYELTTADDNVVMKRCFEKLVDSVNSCDLIENVGGLLRYEKENNMPSTPLNNKPFLRSADNFKEVFEKLISDGFTSEQDKIRDGEFRVREVDETETLKRVFASVGVWFPELYKIRFGSSESAYQPIYEQIADDSNKIKSIYGEITELRKKYYPAVQSIDKNWAFYRRIQVHLLAAVEYCQKYGVDNATVISKKLPNEFQDLEYLIIATLADGFATYEKRLQKLYKLICPNGILIQ